MRNLFSLGPDWSVPVPSVVLRSLSVRCDWQLLLSTWAPVPHQWLSTGHFLWNVPVVCSAKQMATCSKTTFIFCHKPAALITSCPPVKSPLSHWDQKQSPLWLNLLSWPSAIQSLRTSDFPSNIGHCFCPSAPPSQCPFLGPSQLYYHLVLKSTLSPVQFPVPGLDLSLFKKSCLFQTPKFLTCLII